MSVLKSFMGRVVSALQSALAFLQPYAAKVWAWFVAQRRRTQWIVGGIAVFLVLAMCGSIADAFGGNGAPQTANQPTATTAGYVPPNQQDVPTVTPAVVATNTPKPKPTAVKVPPTAIPATSVPATQPPPPAYPAINGNPYDINFTCCKLIYSPPADVCNWFNCINNFYNGVGFMNECNDGTYSMSGGRTGDCSQHGKEKQAVYLP